MQQEIQSSNDNIFVNHQKGEPTHPAGVVCSALSESSVKIIDNNLKGFRTKKEIEPEDNIERDEVGSSQSDEEYDTELDTDELIGNHFNNTSSNNSQEDQEKMLGSITTNKLEDTKKSRVSGGIKCLRNFRTNKNKVASKQGNRKKKLN